MRKCFRTRVMFWMGEMFEMKMKSGMKGKFG